MLLGSAGIESDQKAIAEKSGSIHVVQNMVHHRLCIHLYAYKQYIF